jgi:uracil-DNA glycosylase
METSAEFDPQEVARIVEDALRESNTIHASFIDILILEKLSELLPGYMNSADVTYMLSKIRQEIYKSFRIPSSSSLHNVISHCKKCADEISVNPQAPTWNVVDPDLMIIGMNPNSIQPFSSMMVKALQGAGFTSNRCTLTYLTRCPMNDVSTSCISNCVPYLHTEIHALKPKLIMTLGLEVYAAVTGDDVSKNREVVGTMKWFGLYPILHQYALGYVANAVKKNQGNTDQFDNIFRQAYKFIYNN